MNRRLFVEGRRETWQVFAKVVGAFDRRRRVERADALAKFPSFYRSVCQDLSLARYRRYGLGISGRLNDLVQAGHNTLYGQRRSPLGQVARFLVSDFPREVREARALFWLATALFFVPFGLLMLAGAIAPEWVMAVVDPETRATLAENFGGPRIERESALQDVGMWAFYVNNNVSIDFRIFAGGIAGGLGTLFFIVFNAVHIGAAAGYVIHAGFAPTFFAFVAGHSSLELMAIPISGAAGFKLAQGILAPGRMTRAHALRVRAIEGVRLLAGAAVMTFIAAFIEGYWSASSAPHMVKYVVGALGWVAVIAFLALGGRRAAR